MSFISNAQQMLTQWAQAAEKYWYEIPGDRTLGCYGTGYNAWGVQTNQKYLSAMSYLAARGDDSIKDMAVSRALAALRYSLATHVSGNRNRTDNSRWGHTWISSLGVERMMFGVYMLDEFLTDADRQAIDRMIASEAVWLTDNYKVLSCLLAARGPNKPESNLWNGAVCWRAAMHCPNHPYAGRWQEKAREFLINSVSVPEDISTVARNNGDANFFSNYALDHHAYFNVGYMVICVSNAAMLHFDMKARGFDAPEELHHHQKNLWEVLRGFLFSDGRLFRVGGDTRVRYAYCQDYLLPSLLYAAEHHGESYSDVLLGGLLNTVQKEFDYNADGCFYSKRVGYMAQTNPLYYPRLESDRAGVLAMTLRYNELMEKPIEPVVDKTKADKFEKSVAGGWFEPEYSSCMHRSESRIASFTWHSKDKDFPAAMGFCTVGDDGDICEWTRNLTGIVEPVSCAYWKNNPSIVRNDVNHSWMRSFDGGFATCGEIIEGKNVEMAEGWRNTDAVKHRIAFVALPDNHSVIGLQYCKTNKSRTYISESFGLNLGIPNDLFNSFKRSFYTDSGETILNAPAECDQTLSLNSKWCNIDNKLAAIGLYGADSLSVKRFKNRTAGKYNSLYIEQIGFGSRSEMYDLEADSFVFDLGWMSLSGVDSEKTAELALKNTDTQYDCADENCRALIATACDGKQYLIVANFGDCLAEFAAPDGFTAIVNSSDNKLPSMTVAVFVK